MSVHRPREFEREFDRAIARRALLRARPHRTGGSMNIDEWKTRAERAESEAERLRHIAETLTLANGARERRALRAEAEVRRQDEELVKLCDSSRELRAENERLRAQLTAGRPA